jgi:cell wall-associated NlpC family hydrolase
MLCAMSPQRLVGTAGLAVAGLLCGCASQRPALGGAEPSLRPVSSAQMAPAPAAAGDLVIAALTFLDRPYQAGGQSVETGFDCSGFTRHVFAQSLRIQLPRSADEQAHASALTQVPRVALQAGDLVFFNTLHRTFSHVGIYVGDGRFIHAPRSGAQIRLEDMASSYWDRRFSGARRAMALMQPLASAAPVSQ